MDEFNAQDIKYFEQELLSLYKTIQVPLMTRRMDFHNQDPMDELVEVYEEVKQLETNLTRAI